jgi:uncharacterized membrane protein
MDPIKLLRNILPLSLLFIVIDIPWLWISSSYTQDMIKKIQGGMPLRMRWEAVAPVYFALAYLLQQTHSNSGAFLMGLCVYAIYDFTNLSTLTNYRVEFAIADSLWGGVLFTLVRQAALWLNLI